MIIGDRVVKSTLKGICYGVAESRMYPEMGVVQHGNERAGYKEGYNGSISS